MIWILCLRLKNTLNAPFNYFLDAFKINFVRLVLDSCFPWQQLKLWEFNMDSSSVVKAPHSKSWYSRCGSEWGNLPLKQTWWWRYSVSSALVLPQRRTRTSDWPSRCLPRSLLPAVRKYETHVQKWSIRPSPITNNKANLSSNLWMANEIMLVHLFVLSGGKEPLLFTH